MDPAVEAGNLPVGIADQYLVFLAAIHGNATDVRDLIIQRVALVFIDTVESD